MQCFHAVFLSVQGGSLFRPDLGLTAASLEAINTSMFLEPQLMIPQIRPQAQLAFLVKAATIRISGLRAYSFKFT